MGMAMSQWADGVNAELGRRADHIYLLEQALREAREKLKLYRAEHSGVYVGGVEYTELMSRIDALLKN
jgi:hypothetical protein